MIETGVWNIVLVSAAIKVKRISASRGGFEEERGLLQSWRNRACSETEGKEIYAG